MNTDDLLRQKLEQAATEITFLKADIASYKANYLHKKIVATEIIKELKKARNIIITALGGLLINLILFKFGFMIGSFCTIILVGIFIFHLFKNDKYLKYLNTKYKND